MWEVPLYDLSADGIYSMVGAGKAGSRGLTKVYRGARDWVTHGHVRHVVTVVIIAHVCACLQALQEQSS